MEPVARARSMASLFLAKARASMTAPMNVDRSAATSPMVRDSAVATSSSRTADQIERGTYAREAAEHFWPWYSNAPGISAVDSRGGAGGGGASTKSLPPVSPTSLG